MTDNVCRTCPACLSAESVREGHLFTCDNPVCSDTATRIFIVMLPSKGLMCWRYACGSDGHRDVVIQVAKMMIGAHRPDAQSVTLVRDLTSPMHDARQ